MTTDIVTSYKIPPEIVKRLQRNIIDPFTEETQRVIR